MVVKPIPETNEYELVEPLVYYVNKIRYEAPQGFRFRGSIPKVLWTPLVSSYDPKCLRGFCIHDHLYDTGVCSKEDADFKLRSVVRADGLDKDTAEMIYSGVKWFGGLAWNHED